MGLWHYQVEQQCRAYQTLCKRLSDGDIVWQSGKEMEKNEGEPDSAERTGGNHGTVGSRHP